MNFQEEVTKYRKRDTAAAIGVYVLFMAWAALAVVFSEYDVNQRQAISLIGAAVLTALVFGVVLLKKQGLRSIGLHGERLGKAAVLGLIFAVIPIIINIALPPILYEDMQLAPIMRSLWLFFYFFVMAAYEDIFFVGFLQTRLYGVFRTDRLAIGVGAAMFAFVHVPIALLSGISLGAELLMYLVGVFFMHQALVLIFRRYFSLVAVTLAHTIINWSYTSLWIWGGENYSFFWASVAGLVFVVAVNVWGWWISRK
ncbi:MAG: CPBP family glutamic-type intramembrane protease [Defluviitaleaceae bacterium]|nr:CPBP family glutamic-type intramembrane protease [Defluviitaleaceae bacterium]